METNVSSPCYLKRWISPDSWHWIGHKTPSSQWIYVRDNKKSYWGCQCSTRGRSNTYIVTYNSNSSHLIFFVEQVYLSTKLTSELLLEHKYLNIHGSKSWNPKFLPVLTMDSFAAEYPQSLEGVVVRLQRKRGFRGILEWRQQKM